MKALDAMDPSEQDVVDGVHEGSGRDGSIGTGCGGHRKHVYQPA